MKTLLLLPILLLLTGCVTTPNGTKKIDSDRVARIAGRSAYIGGTIYLRSKPEDRGRFEAAVTALKIVEAMDSPDGSAMAQAMSGLPIRQLDSNEGFIVVELAAMIWDDELSKLIPISQPELVRKVAPQIRSGLERALETTNTL